MRKTYVALLLAQAFACTFCFAQNNVTELIESNSYTVEPFVDNGVLKKLPFNKVVLIDSRFDTSKIGYTKKGGSYKKMVLETGSLQAHFQNHCDPGSPYSLIIVVKNLWLQETSEAEQAHHKIERSSESTQEFSSCTAKFELYAFTGDTYTPLFRRDSVYTEKSSLKKCADRLLFKPFEDCIAQASEINSSRIGSAKQKLTWNEVTNYNGQRLRYPRFTNDVMEKGIYKTFNDFLQNKVTKQDFYIEFGQHTDEVFSLETNKPVLITDFWGLCDGKKLYVRIGYGIFELARQNNTYDVWGSKMSVHEYVHSGPTRLDAAGLLLMALTNVNKVVTEGKPLQLNMETGEVY